MDLSDETRALLFAVEKHSGQMRKYYENRPYVQHPIRVAAYIKAMGEPTEVVCAAYLHDTVEDCGISFIEITQKFGHTVCRLVDEMTNKTKGSKLPRAEQKALDRERLRTISANGRLLKLVDRFDNMNEIANAEDDFKVLYAKESLLLLDVLKNTYFPMEKQLKEICEEIIDTSKKSII